MNFRVLFRSITLLYCTAFAAPVFAELNSYLCTVKQLLEVDADGSLRAVNGVGVSHIGDTFKINRKTGEVSGASINTQHADSITIIDAGGVSNNLKIHAVIKHWHPTNFILEVVDFEPKNEYPFSGFYKYNHIAGICK